LWIGGMGRFGAWWRARDLAAIDYNGKSVSVKAPEALHGVTIFFPRTHRSEVIH